jgi:hypothetical protein
MEYRYIDSTAGSRSGSEESDGDEGSKDQDMVDLTENEAPSNIEEPEEPFTQEENEEHFIEALLIERAQKRELDTLREIEQAIIDIGGIA